jgi:hypothetical protein
VILDSRGGEYEGDVASGILRQCSLAEIDRPFRDAYCLHYLWRVSNQMKYPRATLLK